MTVLKTKKKCQKRIWKRSSSETALGFLSFIVYIMLFEVIYT